MFPLHLSVRAGANGSELVSTLAHEQTEFSSNRRGFLTLRTFHRCPPWERDLLVDRPGTPPARLTWNGLTAWQGRVEGVDRDAGGVWLNGVGYVSALFDGPYTALWSTTRVDGFKPTLETDVSDRRPKLYTFDTNNRLFIGLTKNTAYATSADVGELYLQAPDGGARQIIAVSFDYEVLLPNNWKARFVVRPSGFGSSTILWDHTANGTTQTGSQSLSFSGTPGDIALFPIYNSTGATYTYTGENGANYLKITNLRVKSTTSSNVYADEIAAALAAYIAAANPSQLSTSTSLIQSPALDLKDVIFEDNYPGDILAQLGQLGDGSGNLYDFSVWEDQTMQFARRGSTGRTWYVSDVEGPVSRSIVELHNASYATYRETGGRTLRTATSSDAGSAARWEVTRTRRVDVNTSDSTVATAARDASIADRKDPRPRGNFVVRSLFTIHGVPVPPFLARAGDTFIRTDLGPYQTGSTLDRIRQFVASEVSYRHASRELTVVPEIPMPSMDVAMRR